MRLGVAAKNQRQGSATLIPGSVDARTIKRNPAFIPHAHRTYFELERTGVEGYGCGLDSKYAILQAVHRGVQRSLRVLREMQSNVQLRVAGFQCAGICALQTWRLRRNWNRTEQPCE